MVLHSQGKQGTFLGSPSWDEDEQGGQQSHLTWHPAAMFCLQCDTGELVPLSLGWEQFQNSCPALAQRHPSGPCPSYPCVFLCPPVL